MTNSTRLFFSWATGGARLTRPQIGRVHWSAIVRALVLECLASFSGYSVPEFAEGHWREKGNKKLKLHYQEKLKNCLQWIQRSCISRRMYKMLPEERKKEEPLQQKLCSWLAGLQSRVDGIDKKAAPVTGRTGCAWSDGPGPSCSNAVVHF